MENSKYAKYIYPWSDDRASPSLKANLIYILSVCDAGGAEEEIDAQKRIEDREREREQQLYRCTEIWILASHFLRRIR